MKKTTFDWDPKLTGQQSFELLALATGEKERLFMTGKTKYSDEPLGKVRVVSDFLPPANDLAFREEGVKVTLLLSKKSLAFFKSEASKHRTRYQPMIRKLLDIYVEKQGQIKQSAQTRRLNRS